MIDISIVPNVDDPTANRINGEFRDDITPGDGQGTPVREDWVNDLYYALIAVMDYADITADNSEEGATNSQFLDAIKKIGIPVGSIIAYMPGYFGDGNNGSFTEVSISLPDWWKLCDGSALNDSDSPIFNGAGRYLSNLTDSRFLMGDIAGNLGNIGGDNNSLAHTHGFTQPTYPNHKHQVADTGAEPSDLNLYTSAGTQTLVFNTLVDYARGSTYKCSYIVTGAASTTFYTKTDGGGTTSGGSVNAVAESRTDKNIPKYLSCKYIMRVK